MLVLRGLLEIVPVVGIGWGVRAIRRREPGARSALIANVAVFMFFVGVTLVGGLSDVLR